MKKILDFKLTIMLEYRKAKNFFTKGYTWSEEVFVISKIENTVPWTYVINYINCKEIIGTFDEK